MSSPLYNHINGQQRSANTNSPTTSNGTSSHRMTGVYLNNNHVDNDFLNHRGMNNSSHTDMSSSSIQSTRPTSKTALLVRQRRAMLQQLSCFICKGYLIDATTIDECMDSFCKSCIVVYLKTHKNCPKCQAIIQKPVESAIRSDKILQDIVYKLIPGLYDDEMKRRREYYRNCLNGAGSLSSDDEDESISLNGNGTVFSGERYGVVGRQKPFFKPTDSIDLSLEPQTRGENSKIYYDNKRQSIVTCFTGSLQQRDLNTGSIFTTVDSALFKTYLRCPGKFTVTQLKKFIAAKFNVCRDDTIHLLYLNESLKDEYSLIDIAYIYDWRRKEHMRLFYIIERDLSRVHIQDDTGATTNGGGHKQVLTRQQSSVGTQATKRVCIDPEPRFYDEKNNNSGEVVAITNPNGRSMRPRNVDNGNTTSGSNKILVKPTTTSPIIKSSSPAYEKRTPGVYSNGLQTRGVQTSDRATSTGKFQAEHNRSLRSQQQPVVKNTDSALKIETNAISSISNNHGGSNKPAVTQNSQVVTQLIPFNNKNLSQFTGPTANNQSSLVTLASFTEAKTNHVLATVTATASSHSTTTLASTMSNTGTNSLGGHSFSFQRSPIATTTNTKSFVAATTTTTNSLGKSTPQLAFKFVTERGITIVRSLSNAVEQKTGIRDGSISGNNQIVASSNASNSQTQQLQQQQSQHQLQQQQRQQQLQQQHQNQHQQDLNQHQRQLNQQQQPQQQRVDQSQNDQQHNQRPSISPNANRASTGTTQSSSPSSPSSQQAGTIHRNSDGIDGVTPRHQIKVKPVYKTFVDPTKLKSPNLKKLGFTAKH